MCGLADEPWESAGLDDGLDAVWGLGEVGEGPAGVDKHIVVRGVQELGHLGQGGSHYGKVRRRLSTTQVRDGPGGHALEAELALLTESRQQLG